METSPALALKLLCALIRTRMRTPGWQSAEQMFAERANLAY